MLVAIFGRWVGGVDLIHVLADICVGSCGGLALLPCDTTENTSFCNIVYRFTCNGLTLCFKHVAYVTATRIGRLWKVSKTAAMWQNVEAHHPAPDDTDRMLHVSVNVDSPRQAACAICSVKAVTAAGPSRIGNGVL
jgi:hypothetical protein